MKLLVIGNCQARPLSNIFANAVDGTKPLDPIILHLAKADELDDHLSRMHNADLILAQATSSDFRVGHLVSSEIRAQFDNKTLIWPNIFYAGQQPNLKYITHAVRGRIYGPLGIYHDCEILRTWYKDRLGIDPVPASEDPGKVHASSIKALQARESGCDVEVSDLIEKHWKDRRLFFTFNHPSRWLLEKVVERLCYLLERPCHLASQAQNEPLGRVAPPSLSDNGETGYQGLVVDPILGISEEIPRHYTRDQLYEAAFSCYDAQHGALIEVESLRYTP